MKKKTAVLLIVIIALTLALTALAGCRDLSAQEAFETLKSAYEISMGIKSDPDNENSKYNNTIYYYKEQDRRGIETVTDANGNEVPVSLKNTTVNVHCDIDDDYILHPDEGFGVYILVDRYVEQKNSAGNMVDDYNNNVVYNAQGDTVTYSEDFPIQGSKEKVTVIDRTGRKPKEVEVEVVDPDLNSLKKFGVNATLNGAAAKTDGSARFLSASTGKPFGFNAVKNGDGLRGQLQQYMTGVSAQDFAASEFMQPYTLSSRLEEIGLLTAEDITFEYVVSANGSEVGGAKEQMNLVTLTFKMTDGYAERYSKRTGKDAAQSVFAGCLYAQIEITFGRISNIFVYTSDPDTTGILAADQEVYNLQISYLGPNLGGLPHTADYCKKCEYTGDIPQTGYKEWKCPECGNTDGKQMDVTDSSWYEEVNAFFKG